VKELSSEVKDQSDVIATLKDKLKDADMKLKISLTREATQKEQISQLTRTNEALLLRNDEQTKMVYHTHRRAMILSCYTLYAHVLIVYVK
jgi:hypothetical protein